MNDTTYGQMQEPDPEEDRLRKVIALRAENTRLRDLAARLAAIAPEGVDDAAVAEANDLTSRAEPER